MIKENMEVGAKIQGLIQWQDHTPRAGECYSLKHLHPFELMHEMPALNNLSAVAVRIFVAFGLHAFTRDVEAQDRVEDRYSDNRETRCFCHERYKHSFRLPTIVREIPTCRKLYFSRSFTGLVNYATFETAEGKTYAVYFDVMLYRKRGPNTVLMTIKSAYEHSDAKRDTTEGRIRFNVLLGHALRGTKPRPPPRAR
jgi:hypothetical protein